jgi:hypothetical protein
MVIQTLRLRLPLALLILLSNSALIGQDRPCTKEYQDQDLALKDVLRNLDNLSEAQLDLAIHKRSLAREEDLLLTLNTLQAMVQGALGDLGKNETRRAAELRQGLSAIATWERDTSTRISELRMLVEKDSQLLDAARRERDRLTAVLAAAGQALRACVSLPPVVSRVNRGRLLLINKTDNLASLANGNPQWRRMFAGFDPDSNSNEITVTPLPEANDIAAYGRFKVAWSGVPDIMEDGKDYPITLSVSTLNFPRGATGANVTLRLNTDMLGTATIDKNGVSNPLPGGVDLFVGNGGGGQVRSDSVTVTLHPTKIDATPTSNAEYSFDIFVGGGPGITYRYQISR